MQPHEANSVIYPVSSFHINIHLSFSLLLIYCILYHLDNYLYVCLLLGCKVVLRGKQLEHGDGEAVIIGGMVLDIHATPSVPPNPRTTTPGKVSYLSIYSLRERRKGMHFT